MKMTKDLVCGMEVDEKKAIKTKYKGKLYHFCSQSCLQAFNKNPEQFVNKPIP